MHGLASPVLFEHEHAWAFRKLGVVLNDNGSAQPIDHVVNENVISGEFFVPVCGHLNLAASHQVSHPLQSLTHNFIRS